MGKKQDLNELTNILSVALRHKIGSIVNENEFYSQRYAKDAENLMKHAEKIALRQNWNNEDKIKIKTLLKEKLRKELEEKEFLDDKKYEIMDDEIQSVLQNLKLC